MHTLNRFIEEKLSPFADRIAKNKYLIVLSHGLMATLPIVIVGSMCIIIADFPLQGFQDFMFNAFGDIWTRWAWDIVVPATIGIMTLIAIIGISTSLAEINNVDFLPLIVTTISAFFIFAVKTEDGGISPTTFDATSLILGIFIVIISGEIYSILLKKNIRIKMPDSVPSFVTTQFSAIVPAFIIISLSLVVKISFEFTSYGTITNFIYHVLQQPLLSVGSSLFGVVVSSFLNSTLWFFGVHGTAVVGAIMDPIWFTAQFENLAIFQQGAELARPFIATMDFANFFIYLGGTGLTFPLTLLMIFKCKSSQMKSLGKLAVLPGLFNVNEPVIFGLPIVLNPIMLIPFIIAPTVSIIVAWYSMKFGLVPYPTGVNIPWTTPLFLAGWLMTNSWRGGVLQIIVTVLSGIIYYPFITSLDKKMLLEEEQNKAELIENNS